MGVNPQYMLASHGSSPFHGSARSLADVLASVEGPEDYPQAEQPPDTWLVQRWSGWEGWTPRDWTPRLQGWKIHVSTTPEDARETLVRATRICIDHDVAFKFQHSLASLLDVNGKQHDRGSSGKFITIYPHDDAQLAVLLQQLETALAGQSGPYILSDLRYQQAPVYVRHGGIMAMSPPDTLDAPVPSVVDAAMHLRPDERRPRFTIPDGVALPDCLQESYARSRTRSSSRIQEFASLKPLHFSNAGGVYQATLPDGMHRTLREARSHTGLDSRGRDATTRQEQEEAVLRDLAGVAGVQRIVGSFWAWEHRYLELDYAPGMAFTSWVVVNSPFHDDDGGAQRARYAEQVVRIGQKLIAIIEAVHSAGWTVGDLHPGNVVVDENEDVTVIDFEDATRVGEPREVGFRVFEFCGPEELSAVESDWYAISRTLMLAYVPDWEIEVIAPDYWSASLARVRREFGDAAAQQIDEVVGRFPEVRRHMLTPEITVEPWRVCPSDHHLIDALDEGIEWSRQFSSSGAFPGDPLQQGSSAESFGYGRAGVVWSRTRLGRPVAESDLDALVAAAQQVSLEPGLALGRAGHALALADAGRVDVAARTAASALEGATERRRLDLFGGHAGAVMAALEVGSLAGDVTLVEQAVAANDRLQRFVHPGTPAWEELTLRDGVFHGLAGLALADVAAHLATGDLTPLERAGDRLRAELDACIVTSAGDLAVKDFTNNRALPYLDWGSAGIWGVALAVERLSGVSLVTPEQREGLVTACSSDLYIYPCLAHGRAGTMSILNAAGHGHEAEVHRQAQRLTQKVLWRDDMAFVAGDGMIRLSSDLFTGAAGVALALHALDAARPFAWMPLSLASTARIEALSPAPRPREHLPMAS